MQLDGEIDFSAALEAREDGALRLTEIITSGLARLTGDVERGEAPRGGEGLGQGAQGGLLSRLPRGVDDEIAPLLYQAEGFGEPVLGGNHVVPVRSTGSGGVEAAWHEHTLYRVSARRNLSLYRSVR